MQPRTARIQNPPAHACAQIYAEVLDCLIIVFDGLQSRFNIGGYMSFAKARHAFEATVRHDGHHTYMATAALNPENVVICHNLQGKLMSKVAEMC